MLSLTLFNSFFCMWTSRKLFHLSFRRAPLPTIHLIWWFSSSIDLKLSNKRQKIFDSFLSILFIHQFSSNCFLFKHTHILVHGFSERKKADVLVPQSCLSLCDLKVCSLPGSSVHGIFQAGIEGGWHLKVVAISFSRRSSQAGT